MNHILINVFLQEMDCLIIMIHIMLTALQANGGNVLIMHQTMITLPENSAFSFRFEIKQYVSVSSTASEESWKERGG